MGSFYAGLAFTRAGVGYVHAFAHQLGGLYHIPHGLANAILLPHVLEFSKPACAVRLADLARKTILPGSTLGAAALADRFIAHVRTLNHDMAIPDQVAALRPEDFNTIIARAFAEAHGTYGIPRFMSPAQARGLLHGLLA
jgi:alcohol dehydrogenase